MAEDVQRQMELAVPELQDLLAKGVFSRAEIREVVRRRRGFEYGIHKRSPAKEDFLNYIQYELNFEALRRKRKAELGLLKSTSISEFATIRRLHGLFQLALRKFKGDLRLWLQYLDFCTQVQSRRVQSRIFASCLRFHGHEPGLWVMAARFEFETNSNAKAARYLMQNGLRLNPLSHELWIEYFRLELLFWSKMRMRAEVLGLNLESEQNGEAVADGENGGADDDDVDLQGEDDQVDIELSKADLELDEDETNGETDLAADNREARELREAVAAGAAKSGRGSAADAKEETHQQEPVLQSGDAQLDDRLLKQAQQAGGGFLSGVVPRLVAQHIMHRFPDDLGLRRQLLEVYRLFPLTAASRAQVYDNIKETKALRKNPEAVALFCQRAMDKGAGDAEWSPTTRFAAVAEADRAFARALSKSAADKVELLRLALEFLSAEAAAVADGDDSQRGMLQWFVARAVELADQHRELLEASSSSTTVARILELWVQALLSTLQVDAARQVLESATRHHRSSVAVWLQRLHFEVLQQMPPLDFDALCVAALDGCGRDYGVEQLWSVRAERALASGVAELVHAVFKHALAARPQWAVTVWAQYIRFCAIYAEATAFHFAVNALLGAPVKPAEAFFTTAVDLELAHANPSHDLIRVWFHQGLDDWGESSAELWLRYAMFELQHGQLQWASQVQYQALKTLKEPQVFIEAYAAARRNLSRK